MARRIQNQPPVLIRPKRPRSEDEDNHGNWKMVYADFATAMMAFFLLLWIGAVSSDEQRDLLADYFNPAAVSRGNSGANAPLAGRSVDTIGSMTSPAARGETAFPVASPPALTDFGSANGSQAGDNDSAFDRIERDITQILLETGGRDLLEAIAFRQTEDGLLIDLIDTPDRPMFASGRAALTEDAKLILSAATNALKRAPNELRLTGHTDASPFAARDYDNMDLSVDRARAVRWALVEAGLSPDRIVRVEGEGDRAAIQTFNPDAPQHRRVSIAVMRRPSRDLGLIGGG